MPRTIYSAAVYNITLIINCKSKQILTNLKTDIPHARDVQRFLRGGCDLDVVLGHRIRLSSQAALVHRHLMEQGRS